MLWVAQYVVSPRGDEGTNVYRYRQEPGRRTVPTDDLAMPCELVRWNEEVSGGGNLVRSYLDLGGPEDVTKDELLRCIAMFVEREQRPIGPISFYGEPCAFNFDVDASLAPRWRTEFARLVQAMLADEPVAESRPADDVLATRVAALASRGDTNGAISIMRALAQRQWAGPIATVIDCYARNVEVNAAGVRAFLAGCVPGILANNYYNSSEVATFYDDWIQYTSRKAPRWGEPIRVAAAGGDPVALEREVAGLGTAVMDWVRAGRP